MEILNRYRSEKVGELVGALAKAQGAYKTLKANEDGPYGKFAGLSDTLDATREALSKNGISFTQHEEIMDGGMGVVILVSTISHESDQFMSSLTRILPGDTLRETGKNSGILKRRQAQTLLGISPSPNDPAAIDDDGAASAEKKLMKEVVKPTEDQKKVNHNDLIDNRQYEELMLELQGKPALLQDILDIHDITSMADLPYEAYYKVLGKIRKIKKTEEEHIKRPR